MRISSLKATNFLAHGTLSVDVPSSTHLLLVTGPNGAGKSATGHAIRLALTGEPLRSLTKKNELSRLTKLGAATGSIELMTDTGKFAFNLGSGKHTVPEGKLPNLLGLLLDPRKFFTLDESLRRSAIRQAAGVKIDPLKVAADLIEAGHPEHCIDVVKDALGNFTLAEKLAKDAAAEARALWKAITGETYGDQKGGTWRSAHTGEGDEKALATKVDALQALRDARDLAVSQLERLKALDGAHVAAEGRVSLAAGLEDAEADVQRLHIEVTRLTTVRDEAKAEATQPMTMTAPCPCCKKLLVIKPGGVLEDASTAPVRGSAKGPEKLRAAQSELDQTALLLQAARTRAARMQAAREVQEDLDPRPSMDDIGRAAKLVSDHDPKIALLQAEVNGLREHAGAAARAKTDEARAHAAHEDVQAFVKLADAIHEAPALYMAKAMDPFNAALDEFTGGALEDAAITLNAGDMEAYWGAVPYPLCSASEQWRIQAAITYALARVSRIGFMLLDEFDTVQPADRGDVLDFLSGDEHVQTILMGTLKSAPELDEGGRVLWLGE